MARSEDKIALVGMGNPLLDISAQVPDSVLTKYGLKLANAVLAEEQHMGLYRELVESYEVRVIRRGVHAPHTPSANASAFFAAFSSLDAGF